MHGARDAPEALSAHGCTGDSTWLLDPEDAQWTEARAVTPDMNWGYFPSGGENAFDEATGRTVIFSDGRVIAYDAGADAWEVLHDEPPLSETDPWPVGPLARLGPSLVYEAVQRGRDSYSGRSTRSKGTKPRSR